jgi:high affinity Mn2+ porin
MSLVITAAQRSIRRARCLSSTILSFLASLVQSGPAWGTGIGVAVLLALTATCRAAGLSIATTNETGRTGNYDWAGAYIGAELGYAAGSSSWPAASAGSDGPRLSGSFDMFREFDAFEGTGSYFEGLEAGYNYLLPSHIVLGVEGDLSFPSDISGSQAVSSVSTGEASYSDTVLLSGTARGRVGYALDRCPLGTAGIAFSRDQIDRTQLSGTGSATLTASPGI